MFAAYTFCIHVLNCTPFVACVFTSHFVVVKMPPPILRLVERGSSPLIGEQPPHLEHVILVDLGDVLPIPFLNIMKHVVPTIFAARIKNRKNALKKHSYQIISGATTT